MTKTWIIKPKVMDKTWIFNIFYFEQEENIIPVEVKAEKNLQAKSLKYFCRKYGPAKAVRLSMGNFFRQTIADLAAEHGGYTLIDLPLFSISQLITECEK